MISYHGHNLNKWSNWVLQLPEDKKRWFSAKSLQSSISADRTSKSYISLATVTQSVVVVFPLINKSWQHPLQVEQRTFTHMRHAPLNRLEAAAGRAHNGAENHEEASTGITLSELCFGFVFTSPFFGSTFPPQLRFSCIWEYFILFYFFLLLRQQTRWPTRGCSCSGSCCHCWVSSPPSPRPSWSNGRGSPRERRTASTRACGWPAAATRGRRANTTIPSWSCPVSLCPCLLGLFPLW